MNPAGCAFVSRIIDEVKIGDSVSVSPFRIMKWNFAFGVPDPIWIVVASMIR